MLIQRTAAENFFTALDDAAPQQLRAIHHFADVPHAPASCEANDHWIAVTTKTFDIHQMRRAYRAKSKSYHPPIVVSAEKFPLYLKTNPVAAEQVAQGTYFGQNGILASVQPANGDQKTAHFALRLLNASVCLTEKCYEVDGLKSAENALETLCCAFNIKGDTPQIQLAQIVDELNAWGDAIPQEQPLADAPACLPQLQAIYDELDNAILVLPHDSAEIIATTDWQAVAEHFEGQFEQIQIVTTTQLKLLAQHQLAIGFSIRRFKHNWGNDILANSPIEHADIIRSALRFIMSVSYEQLPRGYFTTSDSELGKFIHDVQNQLLKIQLQADLLCWLLDFPPYTIEPLDSHRDMPFAQRIDTIRAHLNDWVDYYQTLLQTSV